MKHILTPYRIPLFVLMMIPIVSVTWAANIDLPQTVENALEKELDDYTFRSARKDQSVGKTVYRIEARGRMSRKLRMIIDEEGNVLRKIYEIQHRMEDNKLFREERPFWIRSVYTPAAGDPEQAPKAFLESISKISYSGGNILAFDLFGVKEDGSGITTKADAFYKKMIDRLIYTKIGCFVRVFGKGFSKDPDIRLKTIRSVAGYFKKQNQFIFWIDGPDAASLAKEFKTVAPGLVVAAPGADLEIARTLPKGETTKPTVVIGNMPDMSRGNTHFLLTDSEEHFKALDKLNTHGREREAWTPDNSIVSQQERGEGFMALFDGKTKNGWQSVSSGQQGFRVNDGMLQRTPGGGTLRTPE